MEKNNQSKQNSAILVHEEYLNRKKLKKKE